jgi:hypothetical protein
MAFPTTEEVAQALAAHLAHSDLWPTEPERQQVARHVARAYGSPWTVRRRMASPGGSAAFIVVREDDEVHSDAVEDRAKSVAAALNALEELEDASQ